MKRTNWNDAYPPRCDSPLPPLRTGAPACGTLAERKRWRMVPLRLLWLVKMDMLKTFPGSFGRIAGPVNPLAMPKSALRRCFALITLAKPA